MANTNSTIFEISGTITSFPFPVTQYGTIETIGKDVIGTGTFFQGIEFSSEIVLGGTVDAIDSVSLGYISGGPNPTGTFQICGAVPAAINLPTMAADIATAINSSSTNSQWLAYPDGNSVFIYPIVATNTASFIVSVNMASTSTMTYQSNPFNKVNNLLSSQLRGQQWIWNPGGKEVSKVDFVRDNVSAHLKDAFVTDIPALSTFYTIEENHWHAINFLNVGTASGYLDGVEVPPGVSISFSKANQDGFGTFNMIDPKVVDASTEGCKFLVTVY